LCSFFCQAEDGIRDFHVTGVQTCALPIFAFSIFWTYVWFCQYMLIWYANIPEETTYFKIRQHGPYGLIWYSVFIINFVLPILIRSEERRVGKEWIERG